MRVALLLGLSALLGSGCAPPPSPPTTAVVGGAGRAAGGAPRSERASEPRVARPVTFLHDDIDGAMRRARAEGKVVFVDVWAPWCHTCLSMKSYVLSDPALGAFEDRVVFVAIDSDRPDSAAFLERHAVSSWPTFFLLDPGDRLLGYWPGSGSLAEMRDFIDQGLAASSAAAGAPADDPVHALVLAHAALTRGEPAQAAPLYGRAAAGLPAGSSRRSEALLGWIRTLQATKDYSSCVEVGLEHLGDVTGAVAPADFTYYLTACAGKLPPGPEQARARTAAVARLRQIAAAPHPASTADDRADALSILADVLGDSGDPDGARRANEERLAIMERAAASAKTPDAAATYDYGRAGAYVALGRADEAVRLLAERESQRPDSYEPPARLAEVLAKVGRLPEALAAIDRAIARAYGPRKLRYLKLRAEIQGRMGDRAGAIETTRAEVRGHEALARGQLNEEKLADARKRLADAERAASK